MNIEPNLIDLRTAYLLCGALYITTPVATWIVLSGKRSKSAGLWCLGSMINGLGTVLAAFKDALSPFILLGVVNAILCTGIVLRTQALLEYSNARFLWHFTGLAVLSYYAYVAWVGGFAVASASPATVFLHISLYAHFAYSAVKVSRYTHTQNLLWIAGSYLLNIVLLLFLANEYAQNDQASYLSLGPITALLAVNGVFCSLFSHIGYVGFILELSNRTEAEAIAENARHEIRAQLNQQIAQLQRQRVVAEIATFLAHEINQPLAVVLATAQLGRRKILSATLDETEALSMVDQIISATRRANQVVGKVRQFVSPTKGSQKRVKLNQVIVDSISLLALESHERALPIRYQPLAHGVDIKGDPLLLSQVMINVIRNALQMPMKMNGQSQSGVDISLIHDGNKAAIRITDSGPGFSDAALEQAGQPFFTTKQGGNGLGLSISKTIINEHNGTLDWGNLPEGGGWVEITLPLVSDYPSTEPLPKPSDRWPDENRPMG